MRRLDKLRVKIIEAGLDAVLFYSGEARDANIEYFSGFCRMKGSSFSSLLVTKNHSTLFVYPIDFDRDNSAKVDEVVNLKEYDYVLSKAVKERLTNVKRIGILEEAFPYGLARKLRGFKFVDISKIISELRGVKNSEEIKLIKASCSVVNKGVRFVEENLSLDFTEREFVLELEKHLLKRADGLAFTTILTTGKRSAEIHPFPESTNERIAKGLGLIDFGVRHRGYCSDVTLPFSVGKLNDRQKKIADVVKAVYDKCVSSLKVGMDTKKLHKIAERLLARNGYVMKHGVGHGLGLEVHDYPSITSRSKNEFRNNMVFTIEPGIYVEGVGGCRLENDFLIKNSRVKALTMSRFVEV